jgi:hypothetical protein
VGNFFNKKKIPPKKYFCKFNTILKNNFNCKSYMSQYFMLSRYWIKKKKKEKKYNFNRLYFDCYNLQNLKAKYDSFLLLKFFRF